MDEKIKTKKKPVKKKFLSAVENSLEKKKKTLSALEKLQYLQGLDRIYDNSKQSNKQLNT